MTYQEAVEMMKERKRGSSIRGYEKTAKMCELAIEALEKQMPKKPLRGRCGTLCPTCHRLEYIVQRDALDTHCGFCGQALDWSAE